MNSLTSKSVGFLFSAIPHWKISAIKIGINGSDKLPYVNEHFAKGRKTLFNTAKSFKNSNNLSTNL